MVRLVTLQKLYIMAPTGEEPVWAGLSSSLGDEGAKSVDKN